MSISESLRLLEAKIEDLSASPTDETALRAAFDALAALLSDVSPSARAVNPKSTLAARIEAAAAAPDGRRDAALIVARALSIRPLRQMIESSGGLHVQRKIVVLFEQGAPDLRDYLGISERKITHENFDAIAGAQAKCLELTSLFRTLPSEAKEFASRRQEIFRTLKNSFLRAYLNPYEFELFGNIVRNVMNSVAELLESSDISFAEHLSATIDIVESASAPLPERGDFFFREVAQPFLARARAVLNRIEEHSRERFACNLCPRRQSPYTLERRYPLHEPNRIVRIKIPISNSGPGTAINTSAEIVCGIETVYVGFDRIDIGTVTPGEFTLTFDVLLGEALNEIPLMVELSWRSIRGLEVQRVSFDVIVLAQKSNIDWVALEATDPYSTEIAQGNEFVGRTNKLNALSNRLLKEHMQSSFVTGQKRIGKTSLALAVQDRLGMATSTPDRFEIIYLEYGDYARADAEATVKALGEAIALRLQKFIPGLNSSPDFTGSLAPLNQIAQTLTSIEPHLRFLIVLDEFDEIHPEMYRFGPLAEAFFSNLRTLSAKKNIAMLLVGGENMPFIMGAQGDQLNKFVREPLDYFSRADEWDDFIELVTQRRLGSANPLNWHESAVSEIFKYTNGHPYFTKLLCARVFQNAVGDRDTDVTIDEVARAIEGVIDTLDVNAFAHFWKDGIPLGREEAEVVELKRCRVLVAIARTLRLKLPLTAETIASNRTGHTIAASDIPAILNDFYRRDVLRDRAGNFEFVVPLFEHWLVQRGMGKLISDTLGDELSAAIQNAEDAAYVRSTEIVTMLDSWPLYRGRRITADDVRAWLNQRSSFRDQRILFKLLQNMRFLSEEEVREKLRVAHSIVKNYSTAFTPENRSQRRNDIIITYIDGPGKSGSRYAEKYADENLISTQCIIEPQQFAKRVAEYEEKRGITAHGVVVVDDIAATGTQLASNLKQIVQENRNFLSDRSITLVAVVIVATKEADEKVRESLRLLQSKNVDFRSCEILDTKHFAFRSNSGVWADVKEQDQARALCLGIGAEIYKKDPLGFGSLGLLVSFFDGCPNSTLPVLHASKAGTWRALLPRT